MAKREEAKDSMDPFNMNIEGRLLEKRSAMAEDKAEEQKTTGSIATGSIAERRKADNSMDLFNMNIEGGLLEEMLAMGEDKAEEQKTTGSIAERREAKDSMNLLNMNMEERLAMAGNKAKQQKTKGSRAKRRKAEDLVDPFNMNIEGGLLKERLVTIEYNAGGKKIIVTEEEKAEDSTDHFREKVGHNKSKMTLVEKEEEDIPERILEGNTCLGGSSCGSHGYF